MLTINFVSPSERVSVTSKSFLSCSTILCSISRCKDWFPLLFELGRDWSEVLDDVDSSSCLIFLLVTLESSSSLELSLMSFLLFAFLEELLNLIDFPDFIVFLQLISPLVSVL